jgi:hypothetical protein
MYEEVDLKIFRVFDDLIPTEFEAVPSLRYLGRAATAVNVLNRAQDRWFKSAAFMTELNNQYIQMVNRGLIKAPTVTLPNGATKKISNIRDVFSYQRFDLLNDEMVSKAVEFAFDMAYQNRRYVRQTYHFGRKTGFKACTRRLEPYGRRYSGLKNYRTIR